MKRTNGTAPDLSRDGWPEKFSKAACSAGASTAPSRWLRLETRIDADLREWIGKRDTA